jgi:hypothetical protein
MSQVNVGVLNLNYGSPIGVVIPSYASNARPTTGIADGDIIFQTTDKVVEIYLNGSWVELSDIQ